MPIAFTQAIDQASAPAVQSVAPVIPVQSPTLIQAPQQQNTGGYNYQGAIQAGADPNDVVNYLANKTGYNAQGAIKAGANPQDVLAYMAKLPAKFQNPTLWDDAKTFGQNVATNFMNGIHGIGNSADTGDEAAGIGQADLAAGKTAKGAEQIAEGTGRVILGGAVSAVNAALSPLTGLIQTLVQTGVDPNDPVVQQFAMAHGNALDAINSLGNKLQTVIAKYPNASANAGNLANLITTFTGGAKIPEIADEAKVGLQKTGSAIVTPIKNAKNAIESGVLDTLGNLKETISPTLTDSEHLQAVADDWKAPSQINRPSYNNARAVIAKDPIVTQKAAELGFNPFSHIEDGKFNTEDSAQMIRDDNGKISEDMMEPSLKAADEREGQLPTPVSEIQPEIISGKGSDVFTGNEGAIQSKIDNEMLKLKKKYPNGMTLVNRQHEKIDYAKHGGFSPTNDPKINNIAITNRIISRAMEQSIEKSVPKDLGYKEFNDELAHRYHLADYFDALHGKDAPVSKFQTFQRLILKFGTAKLASHLPIVGGDILSEFGGYQLGKFLDTFVEKMENPFRDEFLANIKIKNPAAFENMKNFISAREAEKIDALARSKTILKLPAPSKLGTAKNPHILPHTEYEKQAEKGSIVTGRNKAGDQYVRDLKTGKITIIPKKKNDK